MQEGHPITYFSENIVVDALSQSSVALNYRTHDKKNVCIN